MTNTEFSNEFDILYNSIASNQAPSLDEYEKSVFLTYSQEQTVTDLYTGRNTKGSAFEQTEELRSNLKDLIKTEILQPEDNTNYTSISKYSKFFQLPDDVLFITYESAIIDDESAGCKNGSEIEVAPVTQDEFHSFMKNPFKQANNRRALRLDNADGIIELVTKYNLKNYTVRYLSKPTPIVLCNLGDGVSVNDVSVETECKLNPILHRIILERAVALAASVYKS